MSSFLKGYKEFEKAIQEIGILGIGLSEAISRPNYLGNGGSEMAFSYTDVASAVAKEVKYVIRREQTAKSSTNARIKVNDRMNALALGLGIDGLEQGVAASFDPPVVITRFVKGRSLSSFAEEDWEKVPQEHWAKLKNTVAEASKVGVSIDPNYGVTGRNVVVFS